MVSVALDAPSWEHLRLISVTPDGALFIGEIGEEPAFVVRLNPAAAERVRQRRAAIGALAERPRLLGLALDAKPAWIAVEQSYGSLATHPPHDREAALAVIVDVADVLAQAHAQGLVHGAVGPASVELDASGRASLSFHGVTIDPVELRAPEEDPSAPRAAGDLFGLGVVVHAVLGAIDDEPTRASLASWAERLCDPDPAARPRAADLVAALSDLPAGEEAAPFTRGAELAPGVFEGELAGRRVIGSVGAAARLAAERLAPLSHPSLPEVLGALAVVHPGGAPLGASVTGPARLRAVAKVASALAAAHAVGVAHGQVSPALIWVDGERASLIGFGAVEGASEAADLAAVRALVPEVSGLESLATAGELAEALYARAGQPRGDAEQHPTAPAAKVPVLTVRFEVPLRAPPHAVWPWIANTERVARAMGGEAIEQRVELSADGPAVHGKSAAAGFDLAWLERPYEWIAGRRLGVVREYQVGPLKWVRSVIELHPHGEGGTRVVQTIEAEPKSFVGRAVAKLAIGVGMKRAFEKAYLRIDAMLAGELKGRGVLGPDAFEDVESLPSAVEKRIEELEAQVVAAGAEPRAARALADLVRFAPQKELARLQPLSLAARFEVGEEDMITACFLATEAGLLSAGWDLLCPSCRVPSGYAEALAQLKDHGHCEVCAVDYALDLSACIELVFQPHASLRTADHGTYCLSSPAHAPHVLAQLTVAPGERLPLSLALGAGAWQLTRVGAKPVAIEVSAAASLPSSAEVSLASGPTKIRLAEGAQTLVVHNDTERPARVRVEGAARRLDALTGARAVSHPLFARVLPQAALEAGVSLEASSMAFLATDDGVLSFEDAAGAFVYAVTLAEQRGRASLERGRATATGALEYEGPAIDEALAGLAESAAGEVVVGPLALADETLVEVARALEAEGRIALAGAAGASGTRFTVA